MGLITAAIPFSVFLVDISELYFDEESCFESIVTRIMTNCRQVKNLFDKTFHIDS